MARDTSRICFPVTAPHPPRMNPKPLETRGFIPPALSERGDDIKAPLKFVAVGVHGVQTHLLIW